MNLKQQLIVVHRWLALAGMIFLLVQFATGMLLVYRWELAQWLDPEGMTAGAASTSISPGDVVAVLGQSWPAVRVERLYTPQLADGTYFVALSSANDSGAAVSSSAGSLEFASLDPAKGQLLRSGSLWQFPVEAALRLHFQPLPGKAGYLLVTVTGAVLLTLLATGFWFWWPRRGRVRQSLMINSKAPPKLRMRQLHRTLGICLSPLALIVALTGVIMAVEMLVAAGGSRKPDSAEQYFLGAERIDSAITLAQEQFPGSAMRDIRFAGQRLKVQFHAPERNPRAVHQVWVDAQELTIDSVVPAKEDRGLWVVLLPIHSGDILAWPGRVLLLVLGAGLLLLTGLGSYLWLTRLRSLTKQN